MTASDAAAAINVPAFKGQRNVRASTLDQKVSGSFTGNHMTKWGNQNEDPVRERAMQAIGEVAWEVGLVVHPDLPWLGASPDGVTNTGRLIEIKCPYKRKPVPGEVPHHYMVSYFFCSGSAGLCSVKLTFSSPKSRRSWSARASMRAIS